MSVAGSPKRDRQGGAKPGLAWRNRRAARANAKPRHEQRSVPRRRRWARQAARLLDTIPFLREVILPSLCVVVYVFAGERLGFKGKSAGAEVVGALVAGAIGFYITHRIRMRGFRASTQLVREVADTSALTPGRPLYAELVHDQVRATCRMVNGLKNDTFTVGSPEQLQGSFDTFFRLGRGGRYCALDSHSPSRYWSDYAWFLDAHAKSLQDRRDNGQATDDARILAIDQDELDNDWFQADTEYEQFVKWHSEHGCELRWISPAKLRQLRAAHKLPTGDDIGLWDKLSVLFTPQSERSGDSVSIKVRARHDFEPELTYSKIQLFMSDVYDASSLLSDAAPGVEMGDATLVSRWDDYVAPDLRWRSGGPYEAFIASVVPPHANVFDAAAGTGADTVNMLQRGYSVTSNEVDPRLAEKAREYAARQGQPISLHRARWEQLQLPGNPKFDVVLVLGNSLCLVRSIERRALALRQFYDILRPGGSLVMDERNFEFMRRERDAIQSHPFESWLRDRNDVMYPGGRLVGYPSVIDDSEVTWSFVNNTPPVASDVDVTQRASEFQPLDLFAFPHGGLYREITDAGFLVRAVFGDLAELARGEPAAMPSYEATSSSGFLTYVAQRPDNG